MDKTSASIIQNKNGDYYLQFYHILFLILNLLFGRFLIHFARYREYIGLQRSDRLRLY